MIRPKKEDFEYYQEGLVFKTVNVLNYSKKQDEYIDYLESKVLNIVDVIVPKGTLSCSNCYWNTQKYHVPCGKCKILSEHKQLNAL